MKYQKLLNHLQQQEDKNVTLSFEEIEQILGFSLPPSAYKHKAWWANGGHSYASAWLDSKRKTVDINQINKQVTFQKVD